MLNVFEEMYDDAVMTLIETLENGGFKYYSDLHNEAFNTGYYVVNTSDARDMLANGNDAYTAIGKIYQYEKDNFGEVYTDLSEPVKVVNMLFYIIGEEVMQDAELWEEFPDNDIEDEAVNERMVKILEGMLKRA